MKVHKKKFFEFVLSCIALFISTLHFPRLSTFLMLCLPFIFTFFGFLNIPKYLTRNRLVIFSIFSLVLFTIINYYQVYNYGIGNLRLPKVIIWVIEINSMFCLGLFLNYRKIPFFPLNFLIINISLYSGAIIFLFLSVGYYNNFSSPGSSDFSALLVGNRGVPNIWISASSDDIMSGPSIDIFSCIGISLVGTVISLIPSLLEKTFSTNSLATSKKFLSFLGVFASFWAVSILFFASLYSSLFLQGRAGIVTLLLCLLFIFFGLGNNKNSIRIVLYLFLSLLLLATASFVSSILKNLSDLGIATRLFEQGLYTPRQELWLIALNSMWDSPWGGRLISMGNQGYVHNIWLDQMRDGGILSMLFLLLFHFAQIPFLIKLFHPIIPKILTSFFVCVSISFFVSFVQQPVLQASPEYFAITCFSFGSLIRLTFEIKKNDRPYRHV